MPKHQPFEPDNKLAETHGGAAAEKAISTGASFSGLAAAKEHEVAAELVNNGPTSIVERNAIRLQTVADLYYAAILGADNLDRLDTLVKRYGWIANSALRAWSQLEGIKPKDDNRDVVDLISTYREDTDA